MNDNKFFNASTTTAGGKPKFMPPQKRQQLGSDTPVEETKVSDQPAPTVESNYQNKQQQQSYQNTKPSYNQPNTYSSNYSNQRFSNQGYNNQDYQNQGYSNKGFGNQGYQSHQQHAQTHSHSHHHSHSVDPTEGHSHPRTFGDDSQNNRRGPSSFFNNRNRAGYLSDWGHRHLRTGHVDKEMEEEEKALFEATKSSLGENTQNYDHLKVEVQNKFGLPIPPIQDDFKSLGLSQCLLDNIDRCGYQKLTIIQRNAIPAMNKGLNLMASSQTGSGKTASFLIPIIQNLLNSGPPKNDVSKEEYKRTRKCYPLVLIMAPTRELAIQIHEEARKFCHLTGILAKVIYGGKESYNQQRYLSWDGCDILVTTPGRLIDFMDRIVDFRFIRCVVLDEADRMLDMGFEPQIRQIMDEAYAKTTAESDILVCMFSATFPKEVKGLAEKYLKKYLYIGIGNEGKTGSVSKTITQELVDARHKLKNQLLFDYIKNLEGKILIFCGTKKAVASVYTYLNSKNIFVSQIHGDLSQKDREAELGLFKNKCSILIATDVASRGLDIPDVAYVLNYDLPTNIESYIHRIGRTGRIGKTGTAISFVTEFDEPIYSKLYNLLKDSGQELPTWFQDVIRSKYQREERYPAQNNRPNKPFHHKWRGGGGGGFGRGGNRNFNNSRGYQRNDDDDTGYDSDYMRQTGGYGGKISGGGGGYEVAGDYDYE